MLFLNLNKRFCCLNLTAAVTMAYKWQNASSWHARCLYTFLWDQVPLDYVKKRHDLTLIWHVCLTVVSFILVNCETGRCLHRRGTKRKISLVLFHRESLLHFIIRCAFLLGALLRPNLQNQDNQSHIQRNTHTHTLFTCFVCHLNYTQMLQRQRGFRSFKDRNSFISGRSSVGAAGVGSWQGLARLCRQCL